jgi:hypothetical protein
MLDLLSDFFMAPPDVVPPPELLVEAVESVDDVPDIWLLSVLEVCVGLLVQANSAKER